MATCGKKHECKWCGKVLTCKAPDWACPWVNGDEVQACDDCEARIARELEESMAVVIDGTTVEAWRWWETTVEVLTPHGWAIWSDGQHVEEDLKLLRDARVPQQPDREDFTVVLTLDEGGGKTSEARVHNQRFPWGWERARAYARMIYQRELVGLKSEPEVTDEGGAR